MCGGGRGGRKQRKPGLTGNYRRTSWQSGRNDLLKTNLIGVPSSLPLPLFLLIILFSRSLPSCRTPLSKRLEQVTFYFAGSLSSVEASLYRRPGLERWKKKAREGRWEGERGKSVVPRALSIFRLLLFLLGYPEGASVEQRVAGLDATRRGLGTGKTV